MIDELVANGAALACPFLAGGLFPARGASLELRVSVRWLSGLALLGLGSCVAHGLGFRPWPMALAVLAAGAVVGWRRRPAEPAPVPVRWSPLVLCVVTLLLGQLALRGQTDVLARPITASDTLSFWYPKASSILHDEPYRASPRCDYPEFGPMIWALTMRITPAGDSSVGRITFAWVPVFWILLLCGAIRPCLPDAWSGRVALLIPAVAACITLDLAALVSGDQDQPLMIFLGTTAVLLAMNLTDRPESWRLETAAFFGGTAFWIKNEAVVGCGALVAAWALVQLVFRRGRPGLPRATALLGVLAAGFPLVRWLNDVDPFAAQGSAFSLSSIAAAFGQGDRVTVIAPYIIAYFRSHGSAAAATLLLGSVCAIIRPRARPVLAFLSVALVVHVGGIFLVYLSTRAPLVWHLETSAQRLLSQTGYAFAVLQAFAAAELARPCEP